MNGLGWVLLWSAIPITLGGRRLVLERLASRRGPVAGSWVSAASLLVIVVLTPLAICGLPQSLSWRLPPLGGHAALIPRAVPAKRVSTRARSHRRAIRSIVASDEARGLSWSSLWWHRLRDGAAREMSVDSRADPPACKPPGELSWSSGAACVPGAIAARPLGVCDCRRRSSSIDDPDVLAEVESFRLALSIKRVGSRFASCLH